MSYTVRTIYRSSVRKRSFFRIQPCRWFWRNAGTGTESGAVAHVRLRSMNKQRKIWIVVLVVVALAGILVLFVGVILFRRLDRAYPVSVSIRYRVSSIQLRRRWRCRLKPRIKLLISKLLQWLNPKREYRNPKQIRNSNVSMFKIPFSQSTVVPCFGYFIFWSRAAQALAPRVRACFGFRAPCFEICRIQTCFALMISMKASMRVSIWLSEKLLASVMSASTSNEGRFLFSWTILRISYCPRE